MKIWMLIMIMGHNIDALEYSRLHPGRSMEMCSIDSGMIQADLLDRKEFMAALLEKGIKPEDIEVKCVESDTKPKRD